MSATCVHWLVIVHSPTCARENRTATLLSHNRILCPIDEYVSAVLTLAHSSRRQRLGWLWRMWSSPSDCSIKCFLFIETNKVIRDLVDKTAIDWRRTEYETNVRRWIHCNTDRSWDKMKKNQTTMERSERSKILYAFDWQNDWSENEGKRSIRVNEIETVSDEHHHHHYYPHHYYHTSSSVGWSAPESF